MSTSPIFRTPTETRSRASFLLAGPKFPILFLAALPAAVVALASQGPAQQLSALISITWFSLVPLALFERWIALALPVLAGGFLIATLSVLPFGSTALTVDAWTTAAMFVLSLPRARIDS
jgi:hypothetical protein